MSGQYNSLRQFFLFSPLYRNRIDMHSFTKNYQCFSITFSLLYLNVILNSSRITITLSRITINWPIITITFPLLFLSGSIHSPRKPITYHKFNKNFHHFSSSFPLLYLNIIIKSVHNFKFVDMCGQSIRSWQVLCQKTWPQPCRVLARRGRPGEQQPKVL